MADRSAAWEGRAGSGDPGARGSRSYGGPEEDVARQRAIQLYTYLREYVQLRTRRVLDVAQYARDEDGAVFWLDDLPRMPGCHAAVFDQDPSDDEDWISVRRPPQRRPNPPPPAEVRPWLDLTRLADSRQEGAPPLHDEIPGADGEWPTLENHPEIQVAYDRYLAEAWTPWRERDRQLAAQQDIYNELFRMQQQQQRLGENYEVVIGLGLLTWRPPTGGAVRRHLLVGQADVRFDAVRGVVSVTAAADGARLALEDDMLEPRDRPGRSTAEKVEELLAQVGDDIFGDESVMEALQAWVHSASPEARFDRSVTPPRDIAMAPRLTLAPALILRRRGERSIVQALDAIVQLLRQGAPVPDSVRRLVQSEAADDREEPEAGVLFPLPANDEQLQVVERLRRRPGVLVQGPPGTGKSHTTANLISHLLAQGKRVLVTSHTPRALEVLRGKIPNEIRQLAVVVLGSDLSGRQELGASVRAISNHFASWNDRAAQAAIATRRGDLESARKRESELLAQLRTLRKAGCSLCKPPGAPGYEGTPLAIARKVQGEATRFDWTRPLVAGGACPLNDVEGDELAGLMASVDDAMRREAGLRCPEPDDLPTPEQLQDMADEERQGQAAVEETASLRTDPTYGLLRQLSTGARSDLQRALDELYRAYHHATAQPDAWFRAAAGEVLAGHGGRWLELEGATKQEVSRLRGALWQAGNPTITGLEGHDPRAVAADVRELLGHLRLGRGLGHGPFRPGVVKRTIYLQNEIRVDGVPCRDPQALQRLGAWLEAWQALHRLDGLWQGVFPPSQASIGVRTAEYEDLVRRLEMLRDLDARSKWLDEVLGSLPPLAAVPRWDPRWIHTALWVAHHIDRESRLDAARRALDDLVRRVEPPGARSEPHQHTRALVDALRSRDATRYRDAFGAIQALAENRKQVVRLEGLLSRLRKASHALEQQVRAGAQDQRWGQRLRSIEEAWAWRRADLWLEHQLADDPGLRLEKELDAVRRDIQEATTRLVAGLAWTSCLRRMTEDQRKSLMAWENAVRRLGKGTGKRAPQWRREAQRAMEGCRAAIPAWIMPIYKVAETVTPRPEAFDVVIVDEASQSGPEALFLHYLARKVVVIGDDQQISPENAGIERAQVDTLIRDHLSGVPLAAHFGADSSLFDLTRIHFPDQVTLREHFRCVPEIIDFSNRLCYEDRPLIPLKQFGRNRLLPAIRTVHVPDGATTPSNVNDAEAAALTEHVVRCVQDPSYRNKTMGVVSLVGEAQTRRARSLLQARLPPEELEARRLVCGDAYAFQGDERDVMFLSLVQASGRRLGSLTDEASKRRFNVAASRAREQEWLFHSVTPDDLHPEGMPSRLLRYCLDPRIEPTPVDDSRQAEIRRRAADPARGRVPAPFRSWVAVDVHLRLVDLGYRVIPGYEVGGLQIDLVVEGAQNRLAVECEDDHWPGDEEFEHRLQRQRALTRSGMRFVRVSGASLHHDEAKALQPLWDALEEAGIKPGAGEQAEEEQEPPPDVAVPEAPAALEGGARLDSTGDLLERLQPPNPGASSAEVPADQERQGESPPATEPAAASETEVPRTTNVRPTPGGLVVPYQVAHLEVVRADLEMFDPQAAPLIRSAILRVLEIESPLHQDVLLQRVRTAFGRGRSGRRIQEVFQRQIGVMARTGSLEVRRGFVWRLPRRDLHHVRVPTGDPASERSVGHVPLEELELAVEAIVSNAWRGADQDEVSARVASLLGWRRRGSDIQVGIGHAVERLVRRGTLVRRGRILAWRASDDRR